MHSNVSKIDIFKKIADYYFNKIMNKKLTKMLLSCVINIVFQIILGVQILKLFANVNKYECACLSIIRKHILNPFFLIEYMYHPHIHAMKYLLVKLRNFGTGCQKFEYDTILES